MGQAVCRWLCTRWRAVAELAFCMAAVLGNLTHGMLMRGQHLYFPYLQWRTALRRRMPRAWSMCGRK